MTEPTDRRVQLRESIHQLVAYWSECRGITPAAFVSVAVYEYLRTCGELNVTPVTTTKPPAAPTPARKSPPAKNPWLDDEEGEKPKPVAKPTYDPKAVALDWADDDGDGEEDDLSQYDDK